MVGSTKNDIDWGLMRLFRETDKCIIRWPEDELPRDYADWEEELEPGETFEVVRYVAPLDVLRDRMGILGFTLDNSSKLFTECVVNEIKVVERQIKKLTEGTSNHAETLIDAYESEIQILKQMTPDIWIQNLRRIRVGNLHRTYNPREPHPEPVINYMLQNGWHGFPGPENNVAIRLAIEACSDEQEIIYDVTDLIQGGYFSATDTLVAGSVENVEDEHRYVSKIIILTEGKSDARILDAGLRLLYPHLADYYSFLEFDSVRYGGGAGNLVNAVKAFAGAGVANRIIALFDNDTAGTSAILGLRDVAAPAHIRIMQLPRYDFLSSYPTLGPSGMVRLDVNSVAASLELFLGEDVLTDGNQLMPVQWTGYDSRLGRYQGEVLGKDGIQDRFFEKVRLATLNRSSLDSSSWNGLHLVFNKIFSAFDDFALNSLRRDFRDWFGLDHD